MPLVDQDAGNHLFADPGMANFGTFFAPPFAIIFFLEAPFLCCFFGESESVAASILGSELS